ncbi:MAG: glycerophosphodiester phosphodiesterase [Planctomycetota bacterium]
MGHRGARHEAPENTLLGIDLALRAGVESIEIDVHRSADGQLVVIHDDTVDRTTDGHGAVVELTLAELRRLDAGQGERVPTLEEVLEAVRGKAELFVEIKAPGCEALVVEALRAAGELERYLVKAFDHRIALAVKELAPELQTGCLLYGRPVDPVGLVRAARADFLSIGLSMVDADLVAALHAAGLKACAWNLNDPAGLPRCAALGLDWLGTDAPTQLCAALRAAG